MKLVMAIVNNDDASVVSHHLTESGYFATKLATTGGFLKAGNTTFLIGTDDETVDDVIAIIQDYSKRREQIIPSTPAFTPGMFGTVPLDVRVGGATIFVLPVERYEKC